jgi:hypothetical protein
MKNDSKGRAYLMKMNGLGLLYLDCSWWRVDWGPSGKRIPVLHSYLPMRRPGIAGWLQLSTVPVSEESWDSWLAEDPVPVSEESWDGWLDCWWLAG